MTLLKRSSAAALTGLLIGLCCLVLPRPAAAQISGRAYRDPVDVKVAVGPMDNQVLHEFPVTATVYAKGTTKVPLLDGQPAVFDVFTTASDINGEQTVQYPCEQAQKINVGAAPNVYSCTVILDGGGTWTVSVVAHVVNFNPINSVTPTVGAGSALVQSNQGVAAGNIARYTGAVKGHAKDILWLTFHTISSIIWLLTVGLFAVLALPRLRKNISPRGIYYLVTKFPTLQRVVTLATLITIGTGTFLMVRQAAYRTPFSMDHWRLIENVPYAKPYYGALLLKLIAYAAVLGATLVVQRDARRQLQAAGFGMDDADNEFSDFDDGEFGNAFDESSALAAGPAEDPWGEPEAARGYGRSATLVRSKVAETEATGEDLPSTRRAATVQLSGAVVIFICVILLKYYHELAEGARAVVNHAS